MCLITPSNLKNIPGSRVISPVDGYIYWHIREDKITADMDKYKTILAFENGFKILEKYFHPIQFKSTSDPAQASILIGFFRNGDPDLPTKFEGNTLAYAYANYQNFKHSSDMFFNDAYKWAELDKPGQEVNLKKVFVHECLHALGFDHSAIESDILFWQYQPSDEINFSQDTIDSIKARYKVEMDKISQPVIEPEKSTTDVISFCKNIINFELNKAYIGLSVWMAVGRYFGLEVDRKSYKKTQETVINFFRNA